MELYNLKDDISEKNNLADKLPKKAAKMKATLENWLKQTNANMPEPV